MCMYTNSGAKRKRFDCNNEFQMYFFLFPAAILVSLRGICWPIKNLKVTHYNSNKDKIHISYSKLMIKKNLKCL